jgi:outer membrane protein TolC
MHSKNTTKMIVNSYHMRRKILILAVLMIPVTGMRAQKILTLKECYGKAFETNKLSGEKDAYSNISKLKDENLSKSWLPTIDANGSLVYNSSVADMGSVLGNLPIPGLAGAIKPLPNEQYKITVDINQTIYDGGAVKGARELEQKDLVVNEKQTEVDLYKIRGQINGFYFNILLLDRQKELLNSYLEMINKRLASMQSALTYGVISRSDIDVLKSEKIKLEQQLSENTIRKESLLKVLADLTGLTLDQSTNLIMPSVTSSLPSELTRPELQLFDVRKEQIEAGKKIIDSKRMPKVFGFATLGYGNPPGSNFFKDEFAPYYIIGAGAKWNIIDWNKSKNEKQILVLQQNILDNRKADLNDNLKRQLEIKTSEIKSLQSLILSDAELIALRKRITASAESQYDNGTITATDYMNEMNSERQSLINAEIHKISLALANIEYLNISGKEIE